MCEFFMELLFSLMAGLRDRCTLGGRESRAAFLNVEKEYSLYDLVNVDNTGRPPSISGVRCRYFTGPFLKNHKLN